MITYKQLSLANIFTDCQNKFDNDKYEFLSILDKTINLDYFPKIFSGIKRFLWIRRCPRCL